MTLLLIGALCIISCSQEALTGGQPDNLPSEAVVTFAVQIPGAVRPATKALTEPDEYEVRSVEVLLFDQGGDFRYIAYADDISETAGHIRSFTVTLVTGNFDLMVLANSREWIELNFGSTLPEGTSRADIEQKLTVMTSGKWQHDASPGHSDYTPIPMWGEKRDVTITPATSFTGAGRIKMTRMLARIDVSVDEALQPDFKLKEVYLYNPYNQGLIIPDTDPSLWDSDAGKAIAPSLADTWSHTDTYLHYETVEMSQTDVVFQRVIYTFEAPAGTHSGHTGNTFLVVGGEYKGEPGYYRIDFAKTESGSTGYLPLLRNHLYDVRIKQIGSKGFATHGMAARMLPMNIEAEISPFNEGVLSHFVYDGQYYLGTDVEAAECWSAASTSQITISTDYPVGWTYTVTSLPDGSGTTPNWISFTKTTDAGNRDILYYSVQENPGPAFRTAYVHLTAGRLTMTLPITQYLYNITSVTVLPDGDIPGGGGDYTFTINGSFDDTDIRIRDVAQNDFPLVSGTVGAHTTSASLMLSVPFFPVNATRTFAFEYYDFAGELWRVIRTADQHGFEITSSLTPDGDIITAGETFDVYVNGRSYPDIYLRAVDQQGTVVSGSLPYLIYGGSLMGQGIIPIEENPGTARRVTLQWSTDQITWMEIVTGVQSEYDFTISSDHTEGASITGTGKSVQVSMHGNFPTLQIKVFSDGVALDTEVNIPGGYAPATAPITRSVTIPNNGLAATRTISVRYTRDGGVSWTELTNGSQGTGNYLLTTGRILALRDAKSNGVTGTDQMTWAEALGIDLIYNTSTFWYSEIIPVDYEPTNDTGCLAYYEKQSDKGLWRPPTYLEMIEIGQLYRDIDSDKLWWAAFDGSDNKTTGFWYTKTGQGGVGTTIDKSNKTTFFHNGITWRVGFVRCVRFPDQ